jgi:hypothetical protein
MTEITPDYTIFNNSHAFMHCGPIGPDTEEIGNDLHIATSGKCQAHWNKNGNKVEYVNGRLDEVSGYNITKENDIARTIVAKNGDIHINADFGDIYLKARNIYIETKGDGKNGCFLVNSNGHAIITGNEVKVAASSNLCLIGKSKITAVGTQLIALSGSNAGWSSHPFKTIPNLSLQNLGSLIQGITQACK